MHISECLIKGMLWSFGGDIHIQNNNIDSITEVFFVLIFNFFSILYPRVTQITAPKCSTETHVAEQSHASHLHSLRVSGAVTGVKTRKAASVKTQNAPLSCEDSQSDISRMCRSG